MMTRIDDISVFDQIPNGTRLGLFGMGSQSSVMLKALAIRPDIEIVCLIDSYKEGEINGMPIIKPDQFKDVSKSCDILLVTVQHFQEILKILSAMEVDVKVAKADKTLFSRCSTIYLPSIKQYGFHTLFVEVTSLCNMSCKFCQQPSMKRPKVHMEYDLFCEIIDQIKEADLVKTIYLFGYGESMLHPQLNDMIRYCVSKDLTTSLVTNGLLLTPEIYKGYIEAGLSSLYISFHNLSDHGYAHRHTHDKTDFQAYRQRMMDVVSEHMKMDMPIRLILAFMLAKPEWITSQVMGLEGIVEDTVNSPQIMEAFHHELAEMADSYGKPHKNDLPGLMQSIEDLQEKGMQEIFEFMDNVFIAFGPLSIARINLKRDKHKSYEKLFDFVEATGGYCSAIASPLIMSDGSFAPCCDANFSVGKISREHNILEILNGDEYQNLITGFKEDRLIMQTCRECMGSFVAKAGSTSEA